MDNNVVKILAGDGIEFQSEREILLMFKAFDNTIDSISIPIGDINLLRIIIDCCKNGVEYSIDKINQLSHINIVTIIQMCNFLDLNFLTKICCDKISSIININSNRLIKIILGYNIIVLINLLLINYV
jgi:hypothetical protein